MSPGCKSASEGCVFLNPGDPRDSKTSMLELEAPGANDRTSTSDGGNNNMCFDPLI